jgi:protocatechuate 3,4-dioxygenase beta subunit
MHADHRRATESDHGHGLADDLSRLAAGLSATQRQRRRAIALLASTMTPPLWLSGCGGGDASSGDAATTATAMTASATTAGPFPADGTNTASGATSDILTASGVVRSDLRASFLTTTTVAPGVPMKLVLTLVNTNSVCSTLQGYAIYVWHCDRAGDYSLYGAATESYLRGVQVTDSSGQVTFTSIVPACYAGRYPHVHIEVFASLAAATTGRNAVLTTQLAMPAAVCNAVYPTATGYAQSVTNFAQVSVAKDMVFASDTAAQLALQTPTMTGNVTDGYTATATVGVAR